jgi:hypothetical protein
LLYVEIDAEGRACHRHYAPYLDYCPVRDDEQDAPTILKQPQCAWMTGALEQHAQRHAIATLVPNM